ncbi:hypothetical protein RJZ56_000899 [Blastomyces dermatitidis]|uniref:Uncharacterized protein n=2 Tax=Ajellomyces dermatitidis TaxID=5039 RepID=F2TD86_AJEDA|nr:uncharacterized protein BDCG_07006 [Blastomyces dermatitidis ER-3]EEQ91886.1 hypothetical protein BDCG_07006 [Blastomyces dermatitidis ER-3]EGE81197.1 hypothetical protein BDDG_04138 [Blastomyces dermatitidis ATCC 18188]EQL34931.1 hypothetical protein BDFG_03364 [Blastomyces dermatitidis ATCC 26199]
MLAARDQENLVHAHRTAAAAKPLNQSTRQLQPKTPGNRAPNTPFKLPLNDENNPLAFGGGRKTGKVNNGQNENLPRPGKDTIAGGNALVTPMAPRSRAPLGMKTTNAKANSFQTPAPPLGTSKPAKTVKRPSTTRKLKHSAPEIQPSQPRAVTVENTQEDVPDIEYMPPKPTPLPDPPEDIPYNEDFPQFKGKNFTRGWHKLFADEEVGEDGLTRKERERKAEQEAYDKRMDALIQEQVDNMELLGINVRQFPDEPCAEEMAAEIMRKRVMRQQPAKRVIVDRSISTVKSRTAARMLSQQPQSTVAPPMPKHKPKPKPKIRFSSGFARPTKQQQEQKQQKQQRQQKQQPTPSNPSTMRHAAATASSRTTVGYSRGRRVSSSLWQKTAGTTTSRQNTTARQATSSSKNPADILSPAKYMEVYGSPPFGSEMWSRCKAAGLFDSAPEYEQEEQEEKEEIALFRVEDDEAADFQLTL